MSFLPADWRELAQDTGALKGLRKDKSVESLLRTLLLHLGCGHSLRETVVRARKAGLADLSDVGLLKRLRKSKHWLHALCRRLFCEFGVAVAADDGFQVRAFDATTVKEPAIADGPMPSPSAVLLDATMHVADRFDDDALRERARAALLAGDAGLREAAFFHATRIRALWRWRLDRTH